MGWRGAEAWIFVSIGDAARSGSTTLNQVIGMADANNHSIPGVTEFEHAIGQLLGAGLITVTEGRYELTTFGRHRYELINSAGKDGFSRWIDEAEKWRTDPPSDAPPDDWTIDPEEFRGAFEKYHQWFQETYRKLNDNQDTGNG